MCEDLKEMVCARLAIANSSDCCCQKDATLSAHTVTLVFSNAMRTQAWLTTPVWSITASMVKMELGFIHFLPPDIAALEGVTEDDVAARTSVMANAGNSNAQLEAARSSELHISGRCWTWSHIWEAACSLEVFFSTFTEKPETSLLITKLFKCVALLQDRIGKDFWEVMRNHTPFGLVLCSKSAM